MPLCIYVWTKLVWVLHQHEVSFLLFVHRLCRLFWSQRISLVFCCLLDHCSLQLTWTSADKTFTVLHITWHFSSAINVLCFWFLCVSIYLFSFMLFISTPWSPRCNCQTQSFQIWNDDQTWSTLPIRNPTQPIFLQHPLCTHANHLPCSYNIFQEDRPSQTVTWTSLTWTINMVHITTIQTSCGDRVALSASQLTNQSSQKCCKATSHSESNFMGLSVPIPIP